MISYRASGQGKPRYNPRDPWLTKVKLSNIRGDSERDLQTVGKTGEIHISVKVVAIGEASKSGSLGFNIH